MKTNYKLWFWIVNAATALLRLSFIGKAGLSIDEAHYWVYAKFLDLSYFDHPPLIAYLIKISTLIFGNTEFAVRFPAVIIFFFASVVFFQCVKKLYNEKTAFFAVIILNIIPVFSFLGGVTALPDSPLALFWILTIFIFLLILKTKNKNYWYLLGFVIGLAFLSKYNAVMLPVSIALYLILSPSDRFWFKKKEPYLALLIAFIMFTPVILWNSVNNWASFGFQLNHGLGNAFSNFSVLRFFGAIGAQAGYVSPPVFIVFVAAAYFCLKDAFKNKDKKALLAACFSFPILIFFNAVSLFNDILPHWPAMGYLSLSIYAAHFTVKKWDIKWFRIYSIASWIFTAVIIIFACLHIMYKIIPLAKFMPKAEAQRIEHGIMRSETVDISNDLAGWEDFGRELRKIVDAYPAKERPFILTHKGYLASQIAFAVPELRVFCFSDRIDAYDIWQRDLKPLKNKNALFISNNYFYFDPANYGAAFAFYSKPETITIYKNGRKIKNFFVTKCSNFQPDKLDARYTADIIGKKTTVSEGLINLDHAVFKFINQNMHIKPLDYLMGAFSYLDSKNFNLWFISVLIVSIVILWNNKKEKFWTSVALLASVLVASSLITYFLKHYFERPRPLATFGDGNVNIFYEKLYKNSFPSGHTQSVFAACAFMFMTVRKYWYLYIILAVGMGFERIYVGAHFPSDVVAGATVGTVTAYVIVTLFKKYSKI
ncbi:glycosyltransferase family 39 protein [Endomicrobium proavitum]|uniref:Putative membrane-associated phospholipid phosphatase n=1 Tax=Endomicrobium proavitum TaxID=1408281 RepID=A0A0G3WHH3_9BACT|nr:glycosyltransferase family 39 protein [Endomicrobium proavitum]AKL97778.1 putative membrane-associated phospholipid phosphatase [Endomicrobium proavitum]